MTDFIDFIVDLMQWGYQWGLTFILVFFTVYATVKLAPKPAPPEKVYDYRPLDAKVDEYIRLTRASDKWRRNEITTRNLNFKVWEQNYQRGLRVGDPEKIVPKPKVDRAPTLTQCELPHKKSEVCHDCDGNFEQIYDWSGTRIRRWKRRIERENSEH
jgi:hypothetical protein